MKCPMITTLALVAVVTAPAWTLPARADDAHHPEQATSAQTQSPTQQAPTAAPSSSQQSPATQGQGQPPQPGQAAGGMMMNCPMMSMMMARGQPGAGGPGTMSAQGMSMMMQGMGMMMQGMGTMMQSQMQPGQTQPGQTQPPPAGH